MVERAGVAPAGSRRTPDLQSAPALLRAYLSRHAPHMRCVDLVGLAGFEPTNPLTPSLSTTPVG